MSVTELLKRERLNDVFDTEFRMYAIEVDGISGQRSGHLHSNFLFSIKNEELEDGFPADTGKPMYYKADMIVNEDHWLHCGYIINQGDRCPKCQSTELVKW